MIIGIISSMHHSEKMLEVKEQLEQLDHHVLISSFVQEFIGKNDEEKEIIKLHQKNDKDAIRDFWRKMQPAHAVLVLNLDRNGIKNYIGGNTLMEMGFAHVLNQKIFLYNPIPDIPFYKTEIEAMKPIVIQGDLALIEGLPPEPSSPQEIISFLKEIEKLKHVKRAIMLSDHSRPENSAEHSWHMALMLMVIGRNFPQANMEKMLRMALLHDLVEVYAGDVPAYLKRDPAAIYQNEAAAARRLFGLLPSGIGQEMIALWEEFEALETKEAKIVKSCDRLQATLQNILSEGKTWKDHQLGLDWIESYTKGVVLHDAFLLQLYQHLFQEIVEKKMTWQGDTYLNQ